MNLVINSQFRPFTYDEMVKPLVQYKEAYDKVEQDYSDLLSQTEMWKDIVNQTNSPEAYEMYKRYSTDLASITDDFSRGMNINNRRALLNMKRRYAQDITPIATADAAMKEANQLRANAGPDAIFEVGEYNSLDQFLHGKKANNNYTSREALTKKTAAMTEAAMAEALKDPEIKKSLNDAFLISTQHTGGSYEELMQAIANNPEAQSRFAQIKQKVMADTGIDRYDSRGKLAIEDAINTGLYAGLDKPVKSLVGNPDHITPVQRHSMAMESARVALAREQFNMSAAMSGMTKVGGKWVYDMNNDQTLKKAVAVAKAKADVKGSGKGGNSSRVTVSSSPFEVNLSSPHESKAISSTNVGEITGHRIVLKDFFDHKYGKNKDLIDRYHPLDKVTIDATDNRMRLEALILRNTGFDSLEEALDWYDVFLQEGGTFGDTKLQFIPNSSKVSNSSTSTQPSTVTNSNKEESNGVTFDPTLVPG